VWCDSEHGLCWSEERWVAVCPSRPTVVAADGRQSTRPEVRNRDAESGICPVRLVSEEAKFTDKPRATVHGVVDAGLAAVRLFCVLLPFP
jgi:hypothetical protein